jgi:hypothetical protein
VSDSNRLTNMVGRLRAYAIVCKHEDFNEAADAIDALMAALKPFADAASMYDLPEDDAAKPAFMTFFAIGDLRAARAAYLGEKE